jgi:hypothetical protein
LILYRNKISMTSSCKQPCTHTTKDFPLLKEGTYLLSLIPMLFSLHGPRLKLLTPHANGKQKKKSYLGSSTITTCAKICISFLEIIMSTCLQYVYKDDNGRHVFACMIHEIHFLMQLVQTHLILHHGSSYIHLCEQNEIIKYL